MSHGLWLNPKPSAEIVKKYLNSSRFITTEENFYNLDGNLYDPQTNIDDLERAIIAYLAQHKPSSRKDIFRHLDSLGYKKQSTIDSHIEYSPLFLKRKLNKMEKTRETYEILFIGDYLDKNHVAATDKYAAFKKILQNLEETDGRVEQKTRNEQTILRNWLFEGKTYEQCAICGKKYLIKSLVAAHKKPRRYCSTNERTDPYIVMPACKFGCDFVYEERWIRIVDGIITVDENKMMNISDYEKQFLKTINGRFLDKRWLQGEKSYFDDH